MSNNISNKSFKYFLSICAIIKNECTYIEEWIEHHLTQGFEHVYLYDNNSSDDLKNLVSKYIKRGILTLTDWPQIPGQCPAYEDCCDKYKNESRWIGFFDIDEFFIQTSNKDVSRFLKENPNTEGFAFYWAVYGSGGNELYEKDPVVDRCIHRGYRSFCRNNIMKTIANPRKVEKVLNPHTFIYKNNKYTKDTQGVDFRYPEKFKAHWDLFRINHYVLKSKEEFDKKSVRGNARSTPQNYFNNYTQEYFQTHNQNQIIDIKYTNCIPEQSKYIIADELGTDNILIPSNENIPKKRFVFDWKGYLEKYPCLERFWNGKYLARLHYLIFGIRENRKVTLRDDSLDNNLIIFLHIAKTGGTSLRTWLYSNYKKSEILSLYGEKVLNYEAKPFTSKEDIENYLKIVPKKDKEKIKCISGHYAYYGIHKLFPNRNAIYIAVVREPLSLAESLYNHFKDRLTHVRLPDKFENWVAGNNSLSKHFCYIFDIEYRKGALSHKKVMDLIKSKIYILHTETLKENIESLVKRRVLPNITSGILNLNTRQEYNSMFNIKMRHLTIDEVKKSLPYLKDDILLYKKIIEQIKTNTKHLLDSEGRL